MSRFVTMTSSLLIFLACYLGELRAGVIFSDNFNAGPSPLWGNEVGSWVATGGVYDSQLPNSNPLTYSGLPFILSDFSIDLDINQLQDGGLWLRSASDLDGVLLVTGGRAGTGTGLYWHIVTGGAVSGILNEVTGLFTPGVSNAHLRVEVSGNTYSAFVNGAGTAATTLTTSAFTTGRVAVYDHSAQTLDNVVVATLGAAAVPEPSSVVLLGISTCAILSSASRRWNRKRSAGLQDELKVASLNLETSIDRRDI